MPSLATLLFMRRGGERIKVGVQRGSEKLSFDVPVVETPHQFDRLADLVDPDKGLVAKLGIVGVEIDSKVAAILPPLRVSSGVIVAAKAANPNVDTPLIAGDVIHGINGAAVESTEGLRAALEQVKPDGMVVLQIERDGKLMYVSFQLD